MGATLRALRALVLLAGFYLLGVILLAALAGAGYLLHLHAPSGADRRAAGHGAGRAERARPAELGLLLA